MQLTPLVVRPLTHWALLTPPAHDRSDGGMTLPAVRTPVTAPVDWVKSQGSGARGHARKTEEAENSVGHRGRLRQRPLDASPNGFHDYELVEYLLALTIPASTPSRWLRSWSRSSEVSTSANVQRGDASREGLTDATIAALENAAATALRLLQSRVQDQPVVSSGDALGERVLPQRESRADRQRSDVAGLGGRSFRPCPGVIALGATALIIVHNHPSDDPTPSNQDIRLTRDLVETGRHMKITIHDHVIVGAQGEPACAPWA